MTELTAAQTAALVPRKSLCVIAGAGTGKTFLLGEKYISLLALHAGTAGEIHAGNILALTYTEKAAAEMKERIERAVQLRITTDPVRSEFWKSIADEFFRCSISTFHGFCSSLIREFSFEAGVDPAFRVMEEIDTQELVSDVVRDLYRRPPEELAADVRELYHYFDQFTLLELTELLLAKWSTFGNWFAQAGRPEELITAWTQLYEQMFCRFRDDLRSDVAVCRVMDALDADPKWEDACSRFRHLLRCDAGGIPAALSEFSAAIKGKRKPKDFACPECWERFTEMRDDIREILAVPCPSADQDLTAATLAVMAAFSRILSSLDSTIRDRKRQRGALDFDDLVASASRLLENPAVLSVLQKRYRYVLVDEVQDNDPVLSRMILALCGDPRTSDKLFIVGDPKQSIYGFRGADVCGIRSLSGKFPGEPVVLDRSFRTVPQILAFVNGIFSRMFASPVEEWMTEYHPLAPCPERADDAGKTILLQYTCGADEEPRTEEAAMLAEYLSRAVADGLLPVRGKDGTVRPAGFGDICVLVEARTSLDRLLHAFDDLGVPYQVHKGQSFYARQEVYDFVNLLTAVVYPDQDAALYGLLRSPYFGISDEILCSGVQALGACVPSKSLTWTSPKGTNDSSLFTRLSRASPTGLRAALDRISGWHAAILSEPLPRVVRRMVLDSGIYAVYAAMPEGPAMTANLEKLLSICRTKSETVGITPFAFVDLMQTSIERNLSEAEADFSDAGDCVKIMTIHAAKGLEFPVTAVAFCGAEHKETVSSILFDPEVGVGFSLSLAGGEKPVKTFIHRYLAPAAIAQGMEEKRRLLYVALTRARDHLILCGARKGETYGKNSFMSWIETFGKDLSPDVCGISVPDRESYAPRVTTATRSRPRLPEGLTVPEPVLHSPEERTDEKLTASTTAVLWNTNVSAALNRGTALHEIFAGRPVEDVVREYGISMDEGTCFAGLREVFLSSPLLEGSVDVRYEQEIAFTLDGKSVAGKIDCLIRTPDGFRVVDFKSGSRDPGLEAGYMREIAVYSLAVEQVFGVFPEACLYYAESGDPVVPAVFSDAEQARQLVMRTSPQTECVI